MLPLVCVIPLQDILAQAEQKLAPASSSAVCRKLSSVGRRVLSLESVSNFHGQPIRAPGNMTPHVTMVTAAGEL